jgi:SAM-dependent methyltransferase
MTSISPNEWHVSDLDRFVAECDRLGGPEHPDTIRAMANFSLTFDTQVDRSLDPFSDEYFAQQMALYIEIASRSFEPTTGELTRIDPIKHSQGANPYLSNNTTVISSHVRTISTVMTVANLPPAARVLDLGCGWGLSSEIMAFCGATIDAVDINPPFVELVNLRAAPRNYDIRARHGEFDSLEADGFYDLILFYECLHHASKPWELIERVKSFLSPTGKIAFAGEPVNEIWWPNWGMRLDYLSVYCIRKFGWFESFYTSLLPSCWTRCGGLSPDWTAERVYRLRHASRHSDRSKANSGDRWRSRRCRCRSSSHRARNHHSWIVSNLAWSQCGPHRNSIVRPHSGIRTRWDCGSHKAYCRIRRICELSESQDRCVMSAQTE